MSLSNTDEHLTDNKEPGTWNEEQEKMKLQEYKIKSLLKKVIINANAYEALEERILNISQALSVRCGTRPQRNLFINQNKCL